MGTDIFMATEMVQEPALPLEGADDQDAMSTNLISLKNRLVRIR